MALSLDEAVRMERGTQQARPVSASTAPIKVYVGNIYGRNIEPQHWLAVDALRTAKAQTDNNMRVRFQPVWNDALVCRARSQTATQFLLDTDFDVHVSIDGDILFQPWQVAQIARQAVTHDIVGGLYVTRSREICRPTSIFQPGQTITFGSDETPQPVQWLATGFLATHRRVFERLAQDIPLCHADESWRFHPFYQPLIVDGKNGPIYLSEDFAFVERARRAGYTPHLAPNVRVYHLGHHAFSLEDAVQKPLTEREITVTYGDDGRYRFETFTD